VPDRASAGLSGSVALSRAQDEVVALASDLIRIDTTNTGDADTLAGERVAAEYVAARLTDAGFEPTYVEAGARTRGNVVVRLPGADPTAGALLVHSHLDVVPAVADEWTVHPLSGEVADGYLWGRGAVDMKHMVAMSLAVACALRLERFTPRRDLVFAFLSDEECGGRFGARWLVDQRPDLFEGVTEAIGEVGGFDVTLAPGSRAYLVQTAEKAALRLRLQARGTPGHGSLVHADNPVRRLAEAVARLERHPFPLVVTPTVRAFLAGLRDLTGVDVAVDDPAAVAALPARLSRLVEPILRDTVNVTRFQAGYADNVVPSLAEAVVDCRVLPGRREAFEADLARLLDDVEWEVEGLPAVETDFTGDLVDRIVAAVGAEDPGAAVLPYLLPASTDAKSFALLGVRHLGFAPLRLPPDLDFAALFHGVDERVPVDALRFGARVLERLLRSC
jgi:acetylornithine deacetylase/succinyl-diaminopimelate desuccinylase-like protein